MSAGMISKVSDEGFVSDMSVSPGNSGGPVFNLKGEIVGIVSKKRIDRFVGQLNFVTSHQALHRLQNVLNDRGPVSYSIFQASTDFDLYFLYSTPGFRKDSQGDAKSYLNIGGAINFWDRLRIYADTNVDNEEVFTEYGLGWNFYIQGSDPVQFYRIIPSIESLKFRWKVSGDEIEKRAVAYALTLKASWFPIYLKASQFTIQDKVYTNFGLGLGF
jgi:serine protease Do